jgi:hypothetical protein
MHHERGGGLPDHPALTRTSDRRGRERRRSRLRVALGSLMLAALGLVIPAGAAAHDGGTAMAISLSAERLPPGGGLEIIGQGFVGDELIDITLVGAGSEVALGAVRASPEGGFAIVLTVPAGTTAGSYRVDATVASGIVQQADVVVDPAVPAPALTPTPADLLAPSLAGREEPIWIWAPLVVTLVAAVGFGLVVRRRTTAPAREAHADSPRSESTLPS